MCDSNCPVCNGIGWVRLDLPVGDPKFGKLVPCPNADRSEFAEYTNSGLCREEYSKTLDDLDDLNDTDKAIQIVKKVLKRGYGMVYLYGQYGIAKSAILKAAVAEYLRDNLENAVYANTKAVYVNMGPLIESTRLAWDGAGKYSDADLMRRCMTAKLLSLDELDKIRGTEYAEEQRFMVLDGRYEMAVNQEAITLLAGNASPAEYGGYLEDRFRDGRVDTVHMAGKSVRPAQSWDWTDK
jgi:DNA replication protein DnaC